MYVLQWIGEICIFPRSGLGQGNPVHWVLIKSQSLSGSRNFQTASFSSLTKVIHNSFFLGINFYFCVEISSAPGGLCVRQTATAIDGAWAGDLVCNCRAEADIAITRAPSPWCRARIVVGWFVEIVSFHQSSLLLTIFLSAGTFDTWWIILCQSTKKF